MSKYDVKTVNGVDFYYIGNDSNGNCRYAVNYRYFLKDEELSEPFAIRRELARNRAKKADFDREISSHLEPFFVCRPFGQFALYANNIKRWKETY